MRITLSSIGTSFATRERARAIAHECAGCDPRPIVLDVSGEMLSPAILAELLLALAASNAVEVMAEAEAEFNLEMARKLVRQLDLADAVSVRSRIPM